ncbi:hypothetical protein APHAL10511_003765 [Amanita phalloides]|nr:hypothetical protein APHAL10511_003765 [Amanita phalloides]
MLRLSIPKLVYCGAGLSDLIDDALSKETGIGATLNTVTNFFQGGSGLLAFLRDTQGRFDFVTKGSSSSTWFKPRRASPEEEWGCIGSRRKKPFGDFGEGSVPGDM